VAPSLALGVSVQIIDEYQQGTAMLSDACCVFVARFSLALDSGPMHRKQSCSHKPNMLRVNQPCPPREPRVLSVQMKISSYVIDQVFDSTHAGEPVSDRGTGGACVAINLLDGPRAPTSPNQQHCERFA